MGRIKSVVSDWNGTLIKDKDEAPILKGLGMEILRASANPFHSIRKYPQCRIFHLLKMKQKLESLYKEKKRDEGFDFVREMYRIFNEDVIKGLPVKYILRFVGKYTGKFEVQNRLDRRILYPLAIRRNSLEKMGILSTGYDFGIARIIKESIYSKNGLHFDFIIGNPLEKHNGIAVGFSLANYKRKHEILEDLFRKGELDPDTCAYIGDSMEDEGCMSLVPYPIVSFYAADDFKQHAASKLKALVLEKERDLFSYLEDA